MLVNYNHSLSDWATGHWEERKSWRGYPYQVWRPAVPRIDEKIARCVFYIYMSVEEAIQGHPDSATGFIFGVFSEYKENGAYLYAVTNRHVIDRQDMETPTLRINTKDGAFDVIETKKDDWSFHPLGSDIAVAGLNLDNSKHEISFLNPDFLLTKEFMDAGNVGAGDDVFMVGNFQDRGGRKRNYPTVRFGNISQNPNEPMRNPHTGLDEESFIVEMRSASGYSGSPVVLSISALFPRFNDVDKENRFGRKKTDTDSKPTFSNMYDYHKLLGIDWGHIITKEKLHDRDGNVLPEEQSVWINSAMAGVVPSWKLAEMLYSEELVEMRKENDERIKKEDNESNVVVDFDKEKKSNDEGITKEEFEDVLRKVARPLKPDDQEKKET